LLDEIRQYSIIRGILSSKLDLRDRAVSQISDSVVFSYSKESSFWHILLDSYLLSVKAMENDFLLRGAIVCGKVIHIENENKLFGPPAFLKAYDIENKKAKFPRIIIDDSIFNNEILNYSQCTDPKFEFNKLLLKDFDEIFYVNYFDKLYTGAHTGSKGEKEHRMLLHESLKELERNMEENVGVKCKYLWFKEKYEGQNGI